MTCNAAIQQHLDIALLDRLVINTRFSCLNRETYNSVNAVSQLPRENIAVPWGLQSSSVSNLFPMSNV